MSLPKIGLNVGTPDFEDIVAAAQTSNNFRPLWNCMAKTRFFVAVNRSIKNERTDFHLVLNLEKSESTIEISEYKDKLECSSGAELVFLTGAQIIRRTPAATTIRLVLTSRNLDMAPPRVDWLKKSLEASKQALLKKQEKVKMRPVITNTSMKTGDTLPLINAISMPMPDQKQKKNGGWDFRVSTLRADTNLPGSHAPILAAIPAFSYQSLELEPIKLVTAKGGAGSLFDASTIRKRHVIHIGLGIELDIPMTWQVVRNEKGIKFLESEMHLVVEVNGRRRNELSLNAWMEMRVHLVMKEMPNLVAAGPSIEFKGRNWGSHITGQMREFRSSIQGDDGGSIYQIYCVQTAKRLVSVCVRAPKKGFEGQRALFEWIVEGLEPYEVTTKDVGVTGSTEQSSYEPALTVAAPAFFSLSFSGRLDRLRFIVFSMLTALAVIVIIGFAPLLFK